MLRSKLSQIAESKTIHSDYFGQRSGWAQICLALQKAKEQNVSRVELYLETLGKKQFLGLFGLLVESCSLCLQDKGYQFCFCLSTTRNPPLWSSHVAPFIFNAGNCISNPSGALHLTSPSATSWRMPFPVKNSCDQGLCDQVPWDNLSFTL